MKILLSNDDGVRAEGIAVMARALKEGSADGGIEELTVVAPQTNCSGASHSLTLRESLSVRREQNGFYAVAGTPTDCVHLAIHGMLENEPDMVIAGINHGANLGDDVLYSGTVAAAIEGRYLGLPAIAVSLAGAQEDDPNAPAQHFQTAADFVLRVLAQLRARPLPQDTILNINVPNLPRTQVRGVRATRLGARHQAQPIHKQDTSSSEANAVYRIGTIGGGEDAGPGTDFHAVESGAISVTPLQIDMTRHDSLREISNWLRDIA